MLKAIAGFKIKVTAVQDVFKLSQNKNKEGQQNIITQLQKRGEANSTAIAGEMEKLINKE